MSRTLDVDKLAKTLPIGLEDMYNTMLYQQAKALNLDTSVQLFLLEWVVFSSDILRLNELASILELCFPSLVQPGASKNILRSACSPLLEILEDETIQVIHHSFTEFLLESRRVDPGPKGTRTPFPVLSSQDVDKHLGIFCL
jgi:hypothetical protein